MWIKIAKSGTFFTDSSCIIIAHNVGYCTISKAKSEWKKLKQIQTKILKTNKCKWWYNFVLNVHKIQISEP